MMNIDFKKYSEDLLFVPLGGADEIGMNLNLYQYKGKWLIIDLGIGFADASYPGVDILVPNIKFLEQHKEDIVGLVLTHAHEDHIGAVQYLWQEIQCPIYTTAFTAAVLKAKLREMWGKDNIPITEIKPDTHFKVGPFEIEPIGLAHSVPEMHAMVISTDSGKIFHTGDWKLDHDPIIGAPGDEAKLSKLGKEGVLAIVCDSTNIFNEGYSGSEGDLMKSLVDIIAGLKKQLVVVTTFASNIARLHSIASAAQKSGRKVALIGRSLHRIYDAAKSTGYLEDLDPFIKEYEIKKYKRSEVLIICTGCQGEEMAAATKFATDTHRDVRMQKGDVIIFSSKIIPGNEKKIFALFNKFVKKGIEIMTERDHFVHVSGHPSRDEVKKIYELLKPRISIPVHGEPAHIHEHAKFARTFGVQAVEPHNGVVIRIGEEGAEKIGQVPSGYLAIDGYFILESDSIILSARRKMQKGIVSVTLITNQDDVFLKASLDCAGCMDHKEDQDFIAAISNHIQHHCDNQIIDASYEKSVMSMVRKVLKGEIGKEPYISVRRIAV